MKISFLDIPIPKICSTSKNSVRHVFQKKYQNSIFSSFAICSWRASEKTDYCQFWRYLIKYLDKFLNEHFSLKKTLKMPKIKNWKNQNFWYKIDIKTFFFHMFTVKRLRKLTDYRESSPEGFSMLNMFTLLFRLKFFTSCVFLRWN